MFLAHALAPCFEDESRDCLDINSIKLSTVAAVSVIAVCSGNFNAILTCGSK